MRRGRRGPSGRRQVAGALGFPLHETEELKCPARFGLGWKVGAFSGGRRRTESVAGHKFLGLRAGHAQGTVDTFCFSCQRASGHGRPFGLYGTALLSPELRRG